MKKYKIRYRYNCNTGGEIYYVIQQHYIGSYFFWPWKTFDAYSDIGPDDKYTSIKEVHQQIERLELAERQVNEYNTDGKV